VIPATQLPIVDPEPEKSSASVIVGVVVGVIPIVLVAAVVVVFVVYKRLVDLVRVKYGYVILLRNKNWYRISCLSDDRTSQLMYCAEM
jgi:hypothetical protein